MGKKSYRLRRLPAEEQKRALEASTRAPDPPRQQASEREFDDVDHSSLHHGFESYKQALEYCVQDGWHDAVFTPGFSSSIPC